MRTRVITLFLGACAAFSGGCSMLCPIFCPPPPPLLSELDWSTPEAAVETYRKAFLANNAFYEFECLSDRLKARHKLGLAEYNLGRDRFLAENHELVVLFLEARLEGVRPVPGSNGREVVVRLARGEHFADFRLVNEPALSVGYTDEEATRQHMVVPLKSLRSVLRARGNQLDIVGLPPGPYAIPPLDSIHKVTVTRRWRLLDIVYLSRSLKKTLSNIAPETRTKNGA